MKQVVELNLMQDLIKGMKEHSDFIQVILGPRQVGKTTGVLHFLDKHFDGPHRFVSADKIFNATPTWIREQWLAARSESALLVIDEVQKIENWAEAVKSLWDEDKRLKKKVKCILLGSSSLELHAGLTESLTGRFNLIQMHHWNFLESQKGYGLSFDEFLMYGGYPGSYPLIKNAQDWASYVKHSIVETVIEKDILQNHTVKSPSLFRQTFEILVSYPAQEISYTKLLGQLQDKGNTDLIRHYIRLYEGAFLIRALEKYSGSQIKIKSSSPKILPLAPSLYYLTLLDHYSNEERGRVFELIVGAQLVRTGYALYYWREKNDEVDYVVKHGRKLWAIEVKSGRKKSAKGLDQFKKRYPEARLLMITPDEYVEFERDPVLYLNRA